MNMQEYLLDSFRFNDETNRRMLRKVRNLPDKHEFIRYFSHLVNSQNKWLARIVDNEQSVHMSWWEPVYEFDEFRRKVERKRKRVDPPHSIKERRRFVQRN